MLKLRALETAEGLFKVLLRGTFRVLSTLWTGRWLRSQTVVLISHVSVSWDGCPLTTLSCLALWVTGDFGTSVRIFLKYDWVFEIWVMRPFSFMVLNL